MAAGVSAAAAANVSNIQCMQHHSQRAVPYVAKSGMLAALASYNGKQYARRQQHQQY